MNWTFYVHTISTCDSLPHPILCKVKLWLVNQWRKTLTWNERKGEKLEFYCYYSDYKFRSDQLQSWEKSSSTYRLHSNRGRNESFLLVIGELQLIDAREAVESVYRLCHMSLLFLRWRCTFITHTGCQRCRVRLSATPAFNTVCCVLTKTHKNIQTFFLMLRNSFHMHSKLDHLFAFIFENLSLITTSAIRPLQRAMCHARICGTKLERVVKHSILQQ